MLFLNGISDLKFIIELNSLFYLPIMKKDTYIIIVRLKIQLVLLSTPDFLAPKEAPFEFTPFQNLWKY